MRICCALLLLAMFCVAQESARSVSGTLIDSAIRPIPNTKISIVVVTEEDILRSKMEDTLRSKLASECRGSVCGAIVYGSSGVAKAIVSLHLSGESHRAKTARTDAGGIFQLNDVKPGLYHLTIEAKGFKPATIDSIGVQRGRQITLPLVQLLFSATH